MTGSQQFSVGGSAVLLASAPAAILPGPSGWFYLNNGGTAALYVGGPHVTSGNGAQLAAAGTMTGYLFPGDQLYALTAAGTSSPVYVLQTGG